MYRQYSRNFVTLKQENGSHTEPGRRAIGTCIIEKTAASAKVIATIQYLRPEHIYKLCLVNMKEHESLCIKIASFTFRGNNKYEARCEFDAYNVKGSGLPIEAFSVVTVICENHTPEPAVVLVGYVRNIVQWRNKMVYFDNNAIKASEKDSALDEIAARENISAVNITEPEMNPAIEKNAGSEIKPIIEKNPRFEIKPIIEKISETESAPVLESCIADNKPEINGQTPHAKNIYDVDDFLNTQKRETNNQEVDYHQAFKVMAQKFSEEIEQLNAFSTLNEEEADKLAEYEKNKTSIEKVNFSTVEKNELDRIFSEYEKTIPFSTQKKDILWVKIGLNELSVLPLDLTKHINHPFLVAGYYRYKHLILGKIISEDDKKYVLGIPSIYDYYSKSIPAELGFRQFKPCYDEDLNDGVYGYWIMTM